MISLGSAAWTLLLLLLLSNWTFTSSAFDLGRRLSNRKETLPLVSQIALRIASSSLSEDGEKSNNDSLALQELAARLRQVRAQTRSGFASDPSSQEAISAQLDLCDQLLSTRFRNLALSRCRAQPSSIHGIGLFATRSIAADELITLYPGDALLAWGNEYGGKPGPEGCPLQAMYGPHVSSAEQAALDFFVVQPSARDFEVVTGKCRSIVGDPARNTDPAYLGHLANDAACLVTNDVDAYEHKSSEGANAAHLCLEGCHFVTIATHDIAENEEILVSYGEGYWKGRGTNSNASSAGAGHPKKEKEKKTNRPGKSGRGFEKK